MWGGESRRIVSVGIAIFLLMLVIGGCSLPESPMLVSRWAESPDRRWVGAEYWANRLQDWRVRDGRLECVSDLPMRTVHLLTRRLSD